MDRWRNLLWKCCLVHLHDAKGEGGQIQVTFWDCSCLPLVKMTGSWTMRTTMSLKSLVAGGPMTTAQPVLWLQRISQFWTCRETYNFVFEEIFHCLSIVNCYDWKGLFQLWILEYYIFEWFINLSASPNIPKDLNVASTRSKKPLNIHLTKQWMANLRWTGLIRSPSWEKWHYTNIIYYLTNSSGTYFINYLYSILCKIKWDSVF